MRPDKIQSLQVYRGIAAILVVLFHVTGYSQENLHFTFLGNIFAFGYTGVDFFFVLSGFIIFFTHGRDIGRPQQLVPYVKRRFIRIFPLYWLVTSVKVLVILLIPSIAKGYERELGVIFRSYLLIPQTALPVIGAGWTLSYELFFYLLFAMAIWLGNRLALALVATWGLAALAFNVSTLLGLALFPHTVLTAFVFNERNLEFVLGCASAYLVLRSRPGRPGIMVAAGVLLFVVAAGYVSSGRVVPSYALMFGIPSFLIVLGSALMEMRRHWRIPRALVYLGDASYSLYLTHALFINVFMLIWVRLGLLRMLGPAVTTLGMVVAALVGSILLYRFAEKPMLDYLRSKLLKRRTGEQPGPAHLAPTVLDTVGAVGVLRAAPLAEPPTER